MTTKVINLAERERLRELALAKLTEAEYEAVTGLEIEQARVAGWMQCETWAARWLLGKAAEAFMAGEDVVAQMLRELSTEQSQHLQSVRPNVETQ